MMKAVLCILLAGSAFAQLPNHQLTPGETRTTSRADICSPAFRTSRFRNTSYATKRQVCRAYGVTRCPWNGVLEIDHLVPLELGGADTVSNLWPEFVKYDGGPGFHVKDRLENELHRKVCSGEMPLPAAQKCIAKNWIQCYQKVLQKKP